MRWVLVVLSLAATPAPAQDAREAAQTLTIAATLLEASEGAQERIAALSQAIEAHDEALAVLREGQRRIATVADGLREELDAREERIAALLSVLIEIERGPTTVRAIHPDGPLSAARAASLIADAAPALEAEAAILRADLDRLARMRSAEATAADDLRTGLDAIQAAREALSAAISERRAIPAAALDTAGLRASAEALKDLSAVLDVIPGADLEPPLALPVEGRVLRRYGEADAAGIERPGWIVTAAPGAPVLAPAAASILFSGPVPGQGEVAILEMRPDLLLVLAGLHRTTVTRGALVARGEILGEIAPEARESDAGTDAGGGASAGETLYIEVRKDGETVDPATWFAGEGD
ncbi:murein hydrolase activator EnvC family protein [Jannaschia aquimarina]|uniref:murein hydrolase activator EnvC family protein n=1 Tax=Jannaschia aquimarina TaxID=935700 RepID=UPI0009FC35C2|nr:peptidoglycan DD-metalloendopeptidase family protein [Jannaschia aquimarina]